MIATPVPFRLAWTQKGARAQVTQDSVQEAVREVYEAHFGRLVGWATPLLGDRDLAHDVATEAFIRLWNHWDEVQDPRPWLYTTVANQVRDHWRKRGREAAAYDRFNAGAPVGEQTPAQEADATTQIAVRTVVEALPERLRVPVLLHYFADLPVAQVATQLGKSPGTIKRDLFDARKLMAEQLKESR